MSGEIVVSETPNWLQELEAKREKRVKARLGHEAGAGAPCLKCADKCPGLDLHFWRKCCKICKCAKEEHEVQDDDIYGWAQFQLLGSKPNKIKRKILLPGKKDELELDWAPKGHNETVDKYLKTLPPDQLPVKGSQAAQDRKQLLQKQIPIHDVDPTLCHELTEDELKKMNEYIAHIKQSSVGIGQIVSLSSIIKGNLHMLNPTEAAIIANRFAKGIPLSEIVKLQAQSRSGMLKHSGLSNNFQKMTLHNKNLPNLTHYSINTIEDNLNPFVSNKINDRNYLGYATDIDQKLAQSQVSKGIVPAPYKGNFVPSNPDQEPFDATLKEEFLQNPNFDPKNTPSQFIPQNVPYSHPHDEHRVPFDNKLLEYDTKNSAFVPFTKSSNLNKVESSEHGKPSSRVGFAVEPGSQYSDIVGNQHPKYSSKHPSGITPNQTRINDNPLSRQNFSNKSLGSNNEGFKEHGILDDLKIDSQNLPNYAPGKYNVYSELQSPTIIPKNVRDLAFSTYDPDNVHPKELEDYFNNMHDKQSTDFHNKVGDGQYGGGPNSSGDSGMFNENKINPENLQNQFSDSYNLNDDSGTAVTNFIKGQPVVTSTVFWQPNANTLKYRENDNQNDPHNQSSSIFSPSNAAALHNRQFGSQNIPYNQVSDNYNPRQYGNASTAGSGQNPKYASVGDKNYTGGQSGQPVLDPTVFQQPNNNNLKYDQSGNQINPHNQSSKVLSPANTGSLQNNQFRDQNIPYNQGSESYNPGQYGTTERENKLHESFAPPGTLSTSNNPYSSELKPDNSTSHSDPSGHLGTSNRYNQNLGELKPGHVSFNDASPKKLSELHPHNIDVNEDFLHPSHISIGAIQDINYPEIKAATHGTNDFYEDYSPESLREILNNIKLPDCHYCKKPFEENEFAVSIDRANALFHAECFKCAGCNQILADNVYFYNKETDNIYCGRDYAKIRGFPRCKACDELIFTKEYCLAENSTFHLKHFCCIECDTPLAGQDYTLEDEMPYCLPCFEQSKASKCNACYRVIKPDEIGCNLNGVHFHAADECFACKICKKPLMGQKMLLRNQKLYCSHECFRADS